MRRLISFSLFQVMLFGLIVCFVVPSAKVIGKTPASNNLINSIEGIVWDPDRRPVPDLYVELQNENYSTLSRTRTNSSGRFSFTGIAAGNYYVKVFTTVTSYLEYTESV